MDACFVPTANTTALSEQLLRHWKGGMDSTGKHGVGDCNWEKVKPVRWSILVHVYSPRKKELLCFRSWTGCGVF